MDICAPRRVTETAAALHPYSIASGIFLLCSKAVHNAPQKVSPAAVVSTASTFREGTSNSSPSIQVQAPLLPKVTIICCMPKVCNRS